MNETEIFARISAESDPEKQTQLLDRLCESNDEMKTRIRAMIDAHQHPDSFFESPIADSDLARIDASISPGTMLGPYKLLQEIGQGGMDWFSWRSNWNQSSDGLR